VGTDAGARTGMTEFLLSPPDAMLSSAVGLLVMRSKIVT
jgi:hypothetical protein